MLPKLKVLFLCTGNACRSQMAEAWARTLLADRVEPFSAGSAPGTLDPRAVRVMAEAGVELIGQRPKHVAEFADVAFDTVVTVCERAKADCPVPLHAKRTLHVGFDDPPRLAAGLPDNQALNSYRRVRDEIRAFVQELPNRLGLLDRVPEAAGQGDLDAVVALVRGAGLPIEGIADFFPEGYTVVRDASDVVAVAGLETHADVGLLRSVAVDARLRGCGLGQRLVDDRLAFAAARGLDAVYLLTTTAADFFRGIGFKDTDRTAAPAQLQASFEFTSICPASAVCLVKALR